MLVFLPVLLRRAKTEIRLDVRIPRVEVERRLTASMAIVRSFLLSPTWRRSEGFAGRIDDGRFRMRVRHGASNGLTRLLYGTLTSTPGGSRIEGEFRTLLWVVLILRAIWLLTLAPLLLRLTDPRVPIAPMLAVWGFVVVIEVVARKMGDRDELRMRDHLRSIFADVSQESRT